MPSYFITRLYTPSILLKLSSKMLINYDISRASFSFICIYRIWWMKSLRLTSIKTELTLIWGVNTSCGLQISGKSPRFVFFFSKTFLRPIIPSFSTFIAKMLLLLSPQITWKWTDNSLLLILVFRYIFEGQLRFRFHVYYKIDTKT